MRLALVVFVLLTAFPANADEALQPYVGRYEDRKANCTRPESARRERNVLAIARSEGTGSMSVGLTNYETEAGGFTVRSFEKQNGTLFLTGEAIGEGASGEIEKRYPEEILGGDRVAWGRPNEDSLYGGVYIRCDRVAGYDPALHDATNLRAFGLVPSRTAANAETPAVEPAAEEEPTLNGGNWARSFRCTYERNGQLRSESECRLESLREPSVYLWENGNVSTVESNVQAIMTGRPVPARWNGQRAVQTGGMGESTCYTIASSRERFCIHEAD